jgi:hypothetical protein
MVVRLAGLAMLSVTIIAGCGGQEAGQAGSPADTTSSVAPPQDGGRYATVTELGQRIGCDPEIIRDKPTHMLQSAKCAGSADDSGTGNGVLVVSIYESGDQASSEPSKYSQLLPPGEVGTFLVGLNWTLNCTGNPAKCEEARKTVGGRLVTVPNP